MFLVMEGCHLCLVRKDSTNGKALGRCSGKICYSYRTGSLHMKKVEYQSMKATLSEVLRTRTLRLPKGRGVRVICEGPIVNERKNNSTIATQFTHFFDVLMYDFLIITVLSVALNAIYSK